MALYCAQLGAASGPSNLGERATGWLSSPGAWDGKTGSLNLSAQAYATGVGGVSKWGGKVKLVAFRTLDGLGANSLQFCLRRSKQQGSEEGRAKGHPFRIAEEVEAILCLANHYLRYSGSSQHELGTPLARHKRAGKGKTFSSSDGVGLRGGNRSRYCDGDVGREQNCFWQRYESRVSLVGRKHGPLGNVKAELSPAAESGSGSMIVDQDEKLSTFGGGGILATGCGWIAREVDMGDIEELRVVADIQATSFHTSTAAFDDLFFDFFKAEVLSSLLYRARHSSPNRYSCLVAESIPDLSAVELPTIVGTVDVTSYSDRQILSHLSGVDDYLYVSGMAVYAEYRRQGIATLLLQACDRRAIEWKFRHLVLHAYEDDMRARSLYARAGYKVIASDPLWMSTWVGRKRRVLMVKPVSD